jgi:glucosamine--fructose-6-phosphate aminotransferase (isomerizing)
MCGIIGATAARNIVPLLVEGLKRLEYRGYDSAGIAVANGQIRRARAVGRVARLAEALDPALHGTLGIAHVRWATHGGVAENNAHPMLSHDRVALVHNGIIENHEAIRSELQSRGYRFDSDTDTEAIVHLIHAALAAGDDLLTAVQGACARLQGAYAIAVIDLQQPNRLVAARRGSPLIVGLGEGENYISSDTASLLPLTRRMIYLQEGDMADLRHTEARIYDRKATPVQRPIHHSDLATESAELGPYRHYMQKEIFEQPRALADTLESPLSEGITARLFGPAAERDLAAIERIQILAAGTSYYAGGVARYWLEEIAAIPTAVEVASEYSARKVAPARGTLVVTISQSGETMDTLQALQHARANGARAALAICNVPATSLVRESDHVFLTRAGIEIGVASTKAFTTQLVAVFLLALALARQRGRLADPHLGRAIEALRHLPAQVQHALNLEPQITTWAERLAGHQHALFLGRGPHYPIALEGALKLKEISYIHAEAYPAGELKHGPLALVDQQMPVIAVAPNDAVLEKLKGNLQQVRARGGQLYVFADLDTRVQEDANTRVIRLPEHSGVLSPIMHVVPLQLLAYHTALVRGTDVDKPRNLAKSVTVE